MSNIKRVVEALDYDDLLQLKSELKKDNLAMSRIVDLRIKEKQKEHGKLCSTCCADIDTGNANTYTLIFGRSDFRKKASFCAIDCLEYFINKLKNIEANNPSGKENVLQQEIG